MKKGAVSLSLELSLPVEHWIEDAYQTAEQIEGIKLNDISLEKLFSYDISAAEEDVAPNYLHQSLHDYLKEEDLLRNANDARKCTPTDEKLRRIMSIYEQILSERHGLIFSSATAAETAKATRDYKREKDLLTLSSIDFTKLTPR